MLHIKRDGKWLCGDSYLKIRGYYPINFGHVQFSQVSKYKPPRPDLEVPWCEDCMKVYKIKVEKTKPWAAQLKPTIKNR